jgi:pimeloyl-ACP methyl ester carboxylesterase
MIERGDTNIAVTDRGGDGPPVILLHGLAGSSRELLPTTDALTDRFRALLVGQSMGAHTAFLTAVVRPDLVDRLVMLEGHVAGDDGPGGPANIGKHFASWPVPFADEAAALRSSATVR